MQCQIKKDTLLCLTQSRLEFIHYCEIECKDTNKKLYKQIKLTLLWKKDFSSACGKKFSNVIIFSKYAMVKFHLLLLNNETTKRNYFSANRGNLARRYR